MSTKPRQTKRKKHHPKGNMVARNRGGKIPKMLKGAEPKYFDFLSVANSIGAGSTFFGLVGIPQGVAQSQRVGDFIQPLRLLFNFSLYTANTDIITTVRLIFIRWRPSDIVAPVIANILETPASANVLSHFNFQLQESYDVLWDRYFSASGLATAPTVASNFGGNHLNIPLKKNPEIDFGLGLQSSVNAIYLIAISDSSLAPFPQLNFNARLYYEDTIRDHPKALVK